MWLMWHMAMTDMFTAQGWASGSVIGGMRACVCSTAGVYHVKQLMELPSSPCRSCMEHARPNSCTLGMWSMHALRIDA